MHVLLESLYRSYNLVAQTRSKLQKQHNFNITFSDELYTGNYRYLHKKLHPHQIDAFLREWPNTLGLRCGASCNNER